VIYIDDSDSEVSQSLQITKKAPVQENPKRKVAQQYTAPPKNSEQDQMLSHKPSITLVSSLHKPAGFPNNSSDYEDSDKSSDYVMESKHRRNTKYSKRKYMMTRTDVLKKTILRALRKEYEFYFFQFLNKNGLSYQYNISGFRTYLNSYAAFLKQFFNSEILKKQYGELPNLAFVVGIFIDFWKCKRFDRQAEENNIMNMFYEVLYKYSHTKFNMFLEVPEVRFLFTQILTIDFLDAFLLRHQTLRKSKERYESWAKQLIDQLNELRINFDDSAL